MPIFKAFYLTPFGAHIIIEIMGYQNMVWLAAQDLGAKLGYTLYKVE